MKNNIKIWLNNYRMINDYNTITSGKVINISFEVYCYIDKNYNKSIVISETINKISEFMSVKNQTMGQDIYLSNLTKELNSIQGILNIIEFKIYNKIGGKYSLNVAPQEINTQTNEISIKDSLTLFGNFNTMFEIKYPTTDIKLFTK